MTDQNDFLIVRLRQGAEEAYRYLFQKYYARLCRIAKVYVGDSFIAESIVSDLFFYIWEHRTDFQINTSLDAYLLRAVRNRCLNYQQQAEIRLKADLPHDAENIDTQTLGVPVSSTPLDQLLEKELEHKIQGTINQLPIECRTVFRMSRYDQSSYEEIAEKLGISVNTVRYHMKNALARLRENLKDYLTLFFW